MVTQHSKEEVKELKNSLQDSICKMCVAFFYQIKLFLRCKGILFFNT
jgi:hypothetical protein